MTQENIKTRPLRAVDARDLCRMVREMAAFFGDTSKTSEHDLLAHCLGRRKTSSVLLAEVGGKPAGFLMTHEWTNLYVGVRFRHIDFMFVRERHRKRGVGSALLRGVARQALKDGCGRIFIDAARNNNAANGLYRKMGFKTTPSLRYRLTQADISRLAET